MAFVAQGSIDLVNERINKTSKAYREAKEAHVAACTEALRLNLLELATRHPEITGFTLEGEYDEDYEEGIRVYVHAQVNDSHPGQAAAYEKHGDIDDELYDWDPVTSNEAGLLAHTAGRISSKYFGSHYVEITVEQLKAMSF